MTTQLRTTFVCALLIGTAQGCGNTQLGPEPTDTTLEALNGDNAAGQNLAGVNLAGANLAGANLAGTNLAGANLGGTNLAGANLAGANLAGNNLAGANLAGNNLAGANLAGTNLAGTNLAGANLAGANLAGTNLGMSTLNGSSVSGAYPSRGAPVAGTYRLNAAAFSAGNAGVNIHSSTATAAKGLLFSGEDLWGRSGSTAGRNSCVVMGVGSSAFSRLVEENRAGGNTMYAALREHSWGFAESSGGAKVLNAWEVVVWGARSYCVFVAVAPPEIDFTGMQGFVKAIFRWNAPSSMTLYSGELGKVRTLSSYTGMMGAAQKLAAGAFTEKVHLAGLMAFASATTNNVSVNVDFSSWVMGADGRPLVLGNVSGAPPYLEGAFMAYEDSAGDIGLVTHFLFSMTVGLGDYPSAMRRDYDAWKEGRRATKPVAKRCIWAQQQLLAYGEPVPKGKCDEYVSSVHYSPVDESGSVPVGTYTTWALKYTQTWSRHLSAQGKTPNDPYNQRMQIPIGVGDSVVTRHDYVLEGPVGTRVDLSNAVSHTQTSFPVLSETYISVNEVPYD